MSHVLVLFVLIVIPVISYLEIESLKKTKDDRRKEFAYYRIYFGYIFITALTLTQYPLSRLLYTQHTFTLPWYLSLPLWLLTGFLAFILIAQLLMLRFSKRMRDATAAEYAKKEHIFPTTKRHQLMFIVLAFIVGISEEIIFRGFLFNYANDWGLSAGLSFIIVSVIFGLGHWQQGKGAIVETVLYGLVWGFLYNQTGSLLIPIIWHVLYDLKVVITTRILQK